MPADYRIYNSPGGSSVFGVQYLLDTTSGVFRPARDTDFAVNVGALNVTTSGDQYLASISGKLAAGISLTGNSNTAYASATMPSVSGSMSASTTGIALQANATRKKLFTQVVGSGGPLFLGYGAAPSAQSFNLLLAPATADIGTNGGTLTDTDYKGAVFCSGYIGCRFVIWEGV